MHFIYQNLHGFWWCVLVDAVAQIKDVAAAAFGAHFGDMRRAKIVEHGTRLIAFLQQGRIAIYLLYSFITLLTLLVVTR